jgi:hypothetical protein
MNNVTAFHIYSFISLKKVTLFHEISCLLCWSEVCKVDSYDISFVESMLTAFGSILIHLIKVGIVQSV